jgi:UDP-N-acetylmuramoyl-L-alanyl-D-glutamate--2,6-diaminopimelate ligase
MEKILRIIEKIIPKKLYKMGQPFYHYSLAIIGAIIYGFPARKIHVTGITGTKGKSTVSELVNAIFEEKGYKTALSNTIRFKIAESSRPNKYKMSLPGRFFIQKFLRDAVNAGCTHAVIEITSEASKQFRHKFVWLDSFIFTNLSPEHIESHGSYEKYRQAKLNIAKNLGLGGKKNTILVVNGDDEEHEHFYKQPADKKIKFSLTDVKPIDLSDGIKMRWKKNTIYSKLQGEFNAYNILAAATLSEAMGISDEIIRTAMENVNEIPGRVQKINLGQGFDVVIDYAHTPDSLEELYKAFPKKKKICVLGNTGGGRDTWKRPVMAKIAEKYCNNIILTNEDPYDEDPEKIVDEMKSAITKKPVIKIMDRRQAIKNAISSAEKGDVVLISGKGTDPYIMEENGKKTPWSDYGVAKEELEKILEK